MQAGAHSSKGCAFDCCALQASQHRCGKGPGPLFPTRAIGSIDGVDCPGVPLLLEIDSQAVFVCHNEYCATVTVERNILAMIANFLPQLRPLSAA